jgi:hypothetical protein
LDHTFFGIQLVVSPQSGDPFPSEIERLIKYSPAEQTLADKRVLYTQLSNSLKRVLPVAVRGYWDLIRDAAKAQQEFDAWCGDIEGTMRDAAPFGGTFRTPTDKLFVVTVAFLVQKGSNSDLTLGDRCDIPEPLYFTRATFVRLIDSMPMLNFATVAGDAIYMVPGPSGVGPSMQELSGEGYDYLKPLT